MRSRLHGIIPALLGALALAAGCGGGQPAASPQPVGAGKGDTLCAGVECTADCGRNHTERVSLARFAPTDTLNAIETKIASYPRTLAHHDGSSFCSVARADLLQPERRNAGLKGWLPFGWQIVAGNDWMNDESELRFGQDSGYTPRSGSSEGALRAGIRHAEGLLYRVFDLGRDLGAAASMVAEARMRLLAGKNGWIALGMRPLAEGDDAGDPEALRDGRVHWVQLTLGQERDDGTVEQKVEGEGRLVADEAAPGWQRLALRFQPRASQRFAIYLKLGHQCKDRHGNPTVGCAREDGRFVDSIDAIIDDVFLRLSLDAGRPIRLRGEDGSLVLSSDEARGVLRAITQAERFEDPAPITRLALDPRTSPYYWACAVERTGPEPWDTAMRCAVSDERPPAAVTMYGGLPSILTTDATYVKVAADGSRYVDLVDVETVYVPEDPRRCGMGLPVACAAGEGCIAGSCAR